MGLCALCCWSAPDASVLRLLLPLIQARARMALSAGVGVALVPGSSSWAGWVVQRDRARQWLLIVVLAVGTDQGCIAHLLDKTEIVVDMFAPTTFGLLSLTPGGSGRSFSAPGNNFFCR